MKSVASIALVVLLALAGDAWTAAPATFHVEDTAAPEPGDPPAVYRLYVLAESPDYVHRIRFGPGGAQVEETLRFPDLYRQSSVAHLLTDHEDPHGVQVDPEGRYVFVTTGHGLPDGKMWKIEAGTARLASDPVTLGPFPASMDVSPDGRLAAAVNFHLHGPLRPSTVSLVSTDRLSEKTDIETCTMPHGSRFHPHGRHHYSVCMMDDQLVEIDVEAGEVSRRFFLGEGEEGPLPADDRGFHTELEDRRPHEMAYHPTCSPTWVQPSPDGEFIYVACNRGDAAVEISFDRWEMTRRFPTGRGAYNLDVTPDGRLLVVTLKQGDGVEFIDLESGETLAREPASTRVVHGVAISPDSRYAFISVEGVGGEPGRVDIFDLETLQKVESLDVGQMASGIAFWKMEEPGEPAE